MPSTSLDLDSLSDRELLTLFRQVKESWQPRQDAIKRAKELRDQSWTPTVPPQWKQTAQPQHSSLAKEIPTRVVGTLTLATPVFSRAPESDAIGRSEAADTVERYHAAAFSYYRRTAVPGKDAWILTMDQLCNKGAVCVGSLFAPSAWSGGPIFLEDGQPKAAYWRDSSGKPTDRAGDMDMEATARAYVKAHREQKQRAGVTPIVRRILQTEEAYPLFVEGRLLALFIERKANMYELGASGFVVPGLQQSEQGGAVLYSGSYVTSTGGGESAVGRQGTLLEVVTANRCRYYLGDKPISHQAYGDEGIVTGYGFVPYAYRVGLEGGDLDWGSYGLPLLDLVDTNIRMIDTLLTYQFNAIHLASFTSWYIDHKGDLVAQDREPGRQPTTFDFQTGTIMDFGSSVDVKPFLHPGLNKDFDQFLKFQIDEVHRIIPRTLQGEAASSGYNTAQTTIQAKAIFNAITTAAELLSEDVAVMDMRHVNDRVPGPIYLEYEKPQDRGTYRKAKLERISIQKKDINDYYQVRATIDRALDHITEGNFRALLLQAGIGDKQWASEGAGIEDYVGMLKRQARDRVMNSPQIMAALEQEAIKQFGLQQQQEEALAAQRIQPGPDGTPLVQLPDGRLVGPGQPAVPSLQGPQGALQGLPNRAALAGAPNMASTHNPSSGLPGRGVARARRRGGAPPGGPRTQPVRPEPQPLGAA